MKWFKKKKEKRDKSQDDSRLPTIKEIIRDNFYNNELVVTRNISDSLFVYIDKNIATTEEKIFTPWDGAVFSKDTNSICIDLYALSVGTFCSNKQLTTSIEYLIIDFLDNLSYSFFLFAEKTVGDTIRSMFINESVVTDEHKEIMRILLNEIFDDYFDLFLIEEAANERLNLEEELLEEERSREQKKRASEKANEMLSPYRSSEFKIKLNELKKELDRQ